ncbi:MAG: DUF2306 domain-containing protein [Burkholderiales bacterium]|nr:DUF2306 domain-containing protein [Burkholderiales bacterium]
MAATFTPAILAHTGAALAALGVGALVFLGRKGDARHRLVGRIWVALMLVTAISSFWIKGSGSFSWIHGLSIFTLFALAGGVFFAATGRIAAHRKTMANLYVGALVISGLFTLLPQRLLGRMLWSSLGLA